MYYKDARVHCEVLNIRAVTTAQPPKDDQHRSAGKLATPQGERPNLQDPTACSGRLAPGSTFHSHTQRCELYSPRPATSRLNSQCSTFQSVLGAARTATIRGTMDKSSDSPHAP